MEAARRAAAREVKSALARAGVEQNPGPSQKPLRFKVRSKTPKRAASSRNRAAGSRSEDNWPRPRVFGLARDVTRIVDAARRPPVFKSEGDGFVVSHNEAVLTFTNANATGNYQIVMNAHLNAGNTWLSPTVSSLASNAQMYEYESLEIAIETAAGALTPGLICIGLTPDVTDPTPSSQLALLTMPQKVSFPVCTGGVFKVDTRSLHASVRGHYVLYGNNSPAPSNTDAKMYHAGRLVVAVSGLNALGVSFVIFVRQCIRLKCLQPLAVSPPSDMFVATGAPVSGQPLPVTLQPTRLGAPAESLPMTWANVAEGVTAIGGFDSKGEKLLSYTADFLDAASAKSVRLTDEAGRGMPVFDAFLGAASVAIGVAKPLTRLKKTWVIPDGLVGGLELLGSLPSSQSSLMLNMAGNAVSAFTGAAVGTRARARAISEAEPTYPDDDQDTLAEQFAVQRADNVTFYSTAGHVVGTAQDDVTFCNKQAENVIAFNEIGAFEIFINYQCTTTAVVYLAMQGDGNSASIVDYTYQADRWAINRCAATVTSLPATLTITTASSFTDFNVVKVTKVAHSAYHLFFPYTSSPSMAMDERQDTFDGLSAE